MSLQRLVVLTCALAALMAVPRPLAAQTTTGAITGVVRDADGAVVPGATVRARHEGTNAEVDTVSDPQGLYSLRGLAVGRYTVSAELAGFQTFQSPGVVVRVNDDVRLDVSLRVGAVTETVTVSGSARAVDTNSSTLQDGRRPAAHREPAAERPEPDAADDARRRRAAGHDHQPHVGRHLPRRAAGVLRRRAGQHHQLRAGRRLEQRPLQQRPEPDAESGRPAGVQRPDQQLQRRVRPQRRRHRQRRDARREQPVPGRRLRLHAPSRDERVELLHAGPERRARALPVRRDHRRSHRARTARSSSARIRAPTRRARRRIAARWCRRRRCAAAISRPSRVSCATRSPASRSRATRFRSRCSTRPPRRSSTTGFRCPTRAPATRR